MPERKLSIPNAASKSTGSQSVSLTRRRTRENLKEKIARTGAIASRLRQAYPELQVPLDYGTTFQLLVAVILSAQCTDAAGMVSTEEVRLRYKDHQVWSADIIRWGEIFREHKHAYTAFRFNEIPEFLKDALPKTKP